MDEIRANGKKWPVVLTAGAFLLFEEARGYDWNMRENKNTLDIVALAWAAASSWAEDHGKPLPPDFRTFCNRMSMEEYNGLGEWFVSMQRVSGDESDAKKKKEEAGSGVSPSS